MELKIEYVKPGDIKEYKNNAREHHDTDVNAIAASIKEFGFNDPIGVWNNEIVEGHGRLLAAIKLGIKKVPIIRLDSLTDEQRKAYALAHNKTAELSNWNFDVLDSELKDIAEIDMSQFGFDMDAVEEPAEIKDDDYEESDDTPKRAQIGDIFELGGAPSDMWGCNGCECCSEIAAGKPCRFIDNRSTLQRGAGNERKPSSKTKRSKAASSKN